MKLVLDEWIVREVIDTLYMARTTLLGITGLDSPQEVAKKSACETAITRRISKAIDIIQQSKQPDADLEAEVERWWNERYAKLKKDYKFDSTSGHYFDNETIIELVRHFAEWGAVHLNVRKEK